MADRGEKRRRRKYKNQIYLENEKSFLHKIKKIFHSFWRAHLVSNKNVIKIAETSFNIYRWTSALALLFLNTSLDLKRDIVHSNVYLLCLKNWEFLLFKMEIAQCFSQIYVKFLIIYHMIMLNFRLMVATFCHWNCWNSYLCKRH